MNPIPGWYSDPSDASQLRWWDGATWTDDTRAHIPHSAPPPPNAASQAPPPPAPPGPGSTSDPTSGGQDPASSAHGTSSSYGTGSYCTDSTYGRGAYGTGTYGTGSSYGTDFGAGSSYGAGGMGSAATGSPYGYGYGTGATATSTATPAPGPRDRSWLSWASIGAAIAVALAVIIVLSVSILGHKSTVSSSQGLTTPSSGTGSGTSTTTSSSAPSTTLVAPPPDSTPFNDPAGVYSIDVNTAWEPPPGSIGGIQLWYLTGVNYGGFRSSLNIVTQTFAAPISLKDYVAQSMRGFSATTSLHVDGTTNTTLADGTAAVVLSYSGSEMGEPVSGQATVAVRGTHAVVVTVVAGADAAATTFNLVAPYVASLHLN